MIPLDDEPYMRRLLTVGPAGAHVGLAQVPGVMRVDMTMVGRRRYYVIYGGRAEDVRAVMDRYNARKTPSVVWAIRRATLWHRIVAWVRWELFVLLH